jgi:hypothetical protein
MMEAARTSEKSVNFYKTTRRNNPEDGHLQYVYGTEYTRRGSAWVQMRDRESNVTEFVTVISIPNSY